MNAALNNKKHTVIEEAAKLYSHASKGLQTKLVRFKETQFADNTQYGKEDNNFFKIQNTKLPTKPHVFMKSLVLTAAGCVLVSSTWK